MENSAPTKTEMNPQEKIKNPPVNYIEVVINDEFMKKNAMPNGGLRMIGGQANWNGEVDLMKYVVSGDLSPEYRDIAKDKIEKLVAGQEKTYHHEVHHIRNRENGLAPHVAAENLREYLAFRVLDELSAFTEGELYNKEMTPENVMQALQTADKKIATSYYGEPFSNETKWYMSQRGGKPEALNRKIDPEKYHKILRQYFVINGKSIFEILQQANKMPEITEIVNNLILKLDEILSREIQA